MLRVPSITKPQARKNAYKPHFPKAMCGVEAMALFKERQEKQIQLENEKVARKIQREQLTQQRLTEKQERQARAIEKKQEREVRKAQANEKKIQNKLARMAKRQERLHKLEMRKKERIEATAARKSKKQAE